MLNKETWAICVFLLPRHVFNFLYICTSFFLGCATHGGAATINPPFFHIVNIGSHLFKTKICSKLVAQQTSAILNCEALLTEKPFSLVLFASYDFVMIFFHYNFVSITANFGWEGTKLIWFNLFKVLFLNSLALLLSNEVWKLSYLFYTRHTH